MGDKLLGAMVYIVPIFLLIFSIIAAYSGIKWGSRLSVAIKEITSSPLKVFFWIVIVFVMFGIYASVSGLIGWS
jgi:hypothetical protein